MKPRKRRQRVLDARKTMDRLGQKLLVARKEAALGKTALADSSLGELSLEGHDLLTTLVNANMDTSLPESQRMSDTDVLDREQPFFLKWILDRFHIYRGSDVHRCRP